jgi:hypothetical protein
VPDGLGDFVDALNNPKEFLTREEDRLKQMQDKLGINVNEIVQVPVEKKSVRLGDVGFHSASASAISDHMKKSSSTNSSGDFPKKG